MEIKNTAEEIIDKIKELVRPMADEMGLELVDVEYKTGGDFLRVFIDRPGQGVAMEDCSALSRRISAELDANDPIPHPYNLEVSSPGLDRPLKKSEDFMRYAGRPVKVVISQPLNGQNTFIGHIGEVQNGMVKIILKDQESVWLPLAQIKKARLEVELKKK
jgi:ribosome maturation factor RimP